jgi:hypothetical protein
LKAEICRQCLDACDTCKEYKDKAVALLTKCQKDAIKYHVSTRIFFDYIPKNKKKEAIEDSNRQNEEIKTEQDLLIFLRARLKEAKRKKNEMD